MDLKEGIQQLILQNQQAIAGFQSPNIVALQNVRASVFQRIVNQGQNSNLGLIGNYSRKPILVGAKSFRTQGARDRFFNSNPSWVTLSDGRRLAVLESGYAGIRTIQGNQAQFVDLFFSGTMMRDFAVEVQGNRILFGFRNKINGLKMRGNEKRFGAPIISLSFDEQQRLINTYTQ